jgi:hypothetical protein
MMSSRNRVQQEQIRKRRNNLLRRHNDFWRLYAIRSWTTLEMPNGRIYTYRSHPHLPAPTDREMVSSQRRRKNLMLTDSAATTPPSRAQNTGGPYMVLRVRPTWCCRECLLSRCLDAEVNYGICYQNS